MDVHAHFLCLGALPDDTHPPPPPTAEKVYCRGYLFDVTVNLDEGFPHSHGFLHIIDFTQSDRVVTLVYLHIHEHVMTNVMRLQLFIDK